MKKILSALTLLAATGVSHAHYIWLEADADGATRAYFGEWENDKREKTGATLDKIKSPLAYSGSSKDALNIERRDDHLAILTRDAPNRAANARIADVVLIDTSLAPREDKASGKKVKTVYHAKAGRNETQARLALELVPVAANTNQFVLSWNGAPLAKTEVKVFGPPKWEKSLRTDDKGLVNISTPWAGRYVIEVTQIEDKAGESAGEKYDRQRHVSTLSFVTTDGVAWPANR